MATTCTPHYWLRFMRLRVPLRVLMLATLVLGTGLGWIVRCACAQRDAVAAIHNLGGTVAYDWEWKDGRLVSNTRPWWPKWFVSLLGVDYFGHVTRVSLARAGSGSALLHVARFSKVESLLVRDQSVTDGDLAYIKGLASLRRVSFENTGVTEHGIQALRKALPGADVERLTWSTYLIVEPPWLPAENRAVVDTDWRPKWKR